MPSARGSTRRRARRRAARWRRPAAFGDRRRRLCTAARRRRATAPARRRRVAGRSSRSAAASPKARSGRAGRPSAAAGSGVSPLVEATSRSRRSRLRARCEPRLSRARAWISSTITVLTVREHLPAPRRGEQQIEATRASSRRSRAGCATSRSAPRRGVAVADRDLDVRAVRGRARRATSAISARGLRRFSLTSTVSARSGETYTTSVPLRSSPDSAAR